MDGVREFLRDGHRLGLRLAIASSSERAWVEPHLVRLGLRDYFDKVICGDDVAPGRTKPHTDVFMKALAELHLRADEAIVLEDSPNGVTAARAAGIFVVAVPNPVTAVLPIEGADLVVDSIANLPLEKLLQKANTRPQVSRSSRPLVGPEAAN